MNVHLHERMGEVDRWDRILFLYGSNFTAEKEKKNDNFPMNENKLNCDFDNDI